MRTIALRDAHPEDLALVSVKVLPNRSRFVTLVDGDRVIAVGGLVFRPDGSVWIAAHITDDARRAKVALHRAGLAIMADARRRGIRKLYALPNAETMRAEAWMARCGFAPTEMFEQGQRVWMWSA